MESQGTMGQQFIFIQMKDAVNEAMDTIIEQNAFNSSGGDLVAKRSARVVEQITEDIEIY